jgi:hypothetical protein
MILWLIDRFGLPGHYHRVWVRLLRDNYVPTNEVRVVSLHNVMKRQLLTKIGNRKAPTWIPDEGPAITRVIDGLIAQLKPRVVVCTSPESLACLGLDPEHATLHNLRGSVYWRSGVPHLVMLPMSAWFSLVSQKEIGAANYGFESQEALTAARSGDGQISESSGDRVQSPATGTGVHGSPSGMSGDTGVRRLASGDKNVQSVPRDSGRSVGLRPIMDHLCADLHRHGSGDDVMGEGSGADSERVPRGQLPGANGWPSGDGSDDPQQFDDVGFDVPDRAPGSSSEADPAGPSDAEGGGVDDGMDGVSDDGDGSDDGVLSAAEDEDSVETEIDPSDPDAGDVDQFFYEPVLSPVGRFVLTADTQKLFRLLRDGKNAAGPSRPIEVNWR